ncbi:MAG TPA: hypothetical protein VE673_14740 [Pseudonocardiaceae bacterium]|nr:hypothetical protein [Pseudonocardiaceae bacterium]
MTAWLVVAVPLLIMLFALGLDQLEKCLPGAATTQSPACSTANHAGIRQASAATHPAVPAVFAMAMPIDHAATHHADAQLRGPTAGSSDPAHRTAAGQRTPVHTS